ncbi:hypothetical protein BVRB_8g194740 [Beta vulgaris subsp. vulgaris]|nr:hypothetical protein BVRB_8g194740 [Beta vulgaris subsp. vulgaris]
MATLPYDIIVREILPKLPARSLLRFKCVSKSFKTQISCPEFINLHLQHGLSNNSNRLLILINHHNLLCMVMDSPKSRPLTAHPCTDYYGRPCYDFDSPICIGSCNGLLCIFKPLSNTLFPLFTLVNPCTGISLMIPHSEPAPKYYGTLISVNSVNFGFGFDSLDNNYKIVCILDYMEGDFLTRDVLVYSLNNTNKSWTWKLALSAPSPNGSLEHNRQNGVLINNHLLHWKFSCADNEYRIGCFDVESEKWVKDVPVPEYRQKTSTELHLGVLDSCLCLLTENLNDEILDVWMMKKYGVKESWVKLFGISDLFIGKDWKLCYLGYCGAAKDEIFIIRLNKSINVVRLLSYNVHDKSLKLGGCFFTTDVCTCHGSLVSLPGGQKIGN